MKLSVNNLRELIAYLFPFLTIIFVAASIVTAVYLLRSFTHSFSEVLFLHVIALVAFAVWGFRKLPFWSANLIFSLMLLAMYFSASMVRLGDHQYWVDRSREPVLDKSEFLSNLLYHIIYLTNGPYDYIAPIAGFFTALTFMVLARNVIKDNLDFAALAFLASTVNIVFFRDFIENPPLSVPFILLYANYLVKYYKQPQRGYVNILAAAFFLAMACLFHGQNTFISPAILLVIFLKKSNNFSKIIRDSGFALLMATGVIFLIYSALSLTHLEIIPGNMHGGGDYQMFVPLLEIKGYSQYTMFSLQNFSKVGNILILVSPLLLISPVTLALVFFSKNRFQPILYNLPLTILSLGYMAFLFLWDFDLGWPTDHDLMTTMGLPLALVYTAYLISLFKNKQIILKILYILVIGVSWYMISGLVRI